MHDNFTQSTPLEYAYCKESYEDEIENFDNHESLGDCTNSKKEEFPDNSNPILDCDRRENCIKMNNVSSPLFSGEVMSPHHTLPFPTFNQKSIPEIECYVLPIF